MKDIEKINDNLQELETRIVYIEDACKNNSSGNIDLSEIQSQIEFNATSIESLQEQVNANTNDMQTLTQNINDFSQTLISLEQNTEINSQNISTNATNIQNLNQNVEQNTQNIISLTGISSTNTTNISSLTDLVQENINNIDNLTTRVETLEENAGSGGGSTGDLTALTKQVEINTTNIAANTETIEDFLSLIKDRNRAYNVPFEELDFSNTYQTYDCYEKRYSFNSDNCKSGPIFFTCTNEGNLKLKITITYSAEIDNCPATITSTLNNTLIDEQTVTINSSTSEHVYFYESVVTAQNNTLIISVASQNNILLEKIKVEFFAKNIFVLNNPEPIQVYTYNDTYYISNCTGDTAKYCIIHKDSLHTTNDIVWIDTGVAANELHFCPDGVSEGGYFKSYNISKVFLMRDNNLVVHDEYFGNNSVFTSTHNNLQSITAALPNESFAQRIQITIYNTNSVGQIVNYSNSSEGAQYVVANSTSYVKNFTIAKQARLLGATTSSNTRYMVTMTRADGTIGLNYSSKLLELPFGLNTTAYYTSINRTSFNVYAKVLDQIVKHTITYTNQLNLTSSEVMGYYDMYFEGVNNDYFYVKNNKLFYVSNNLQDTN